MSAVFQGAQRQATPPWQRVTVRPVEIKGNVLLQFVYSADRQDTTVNVRDRDAEARMDELLAMPFGSIRILSLREELRLQFSKKGRPILHRERRRSQDVIPVDLAHDRDKPTLLPDDVAVPFLQHIGVMTGDGRVRADQRRKFRQINEFLRLIAESVTALSAVERPLRVVDLGCGSAALTFATYYYLNEIAGKPARMIGVDAKVPLMERMQRTARDLGWDNLAFEAVPIADFQPDDPPDIVIALHACDTATDDALARAIKWQSAVVLSAPCCHHHLQAQLAHIDVPTAFRPVLRHGILRERIGDVLTDAFRAHILRLSGYRTDVPEFVPVEHTPKNLMIRAVLTGARPSAALVQEYLELKSYWAVTPYLETLLGDDFQAHIQDASG